MDSGKRRREDKNAVEYNISTAFYHPKTVGYNRFVELMQYTTQPLLTYALRFKVGECPGVSLLDTSELVITIQVKKIFNDSDKRLYCGILTVYEMKLSYTVFVLPTKKENFYIALQTIQSYPK